MKSIIPSRIFLVTACFIILLTGCSNGQLVIHSTNEPTSTETPKPTNTSFPTPTLIGGSSPQVLFLGKAGDGIIYLYLLDLYSKELTQLTQLKFTSGQNWVPLAFWSDDGKKAFFLDVNQSGWYSLFSFDFNQNMINEVLSPSRNLDTWGYEVSTDSKYLFYYTSTRANPVMVCHLRDLETNYDKIFDCNEWDEYKGESSEKPLPTSIASLTQPVATDTGRVVGNIVEMLEDGYSVFAWSPDEKDLLVGMGSYDQINSSSLYLYLPEEDLDLYLSLNDDWYLAIVNVETGKELAIYELPENIDPYFCSSIYCSNGIDVIWK